MRYFLLCFSFLSALAISAQIPDYMSIKPIMMAGEQKLRDIERRGYNVLHMEYDLIFKDRNKDVSVLLYAGKPFSFRAFAQEGFFNDIDIAIYRDGGDTWDLVKKETAEGREAFLDFTPATTGSYKIRITGYDFVSGYTAGKYGLIVYY